MILSVWKTHRRVRAQDRLPSLFAVSDGSMNKSAPKFKARARQGDALFIPPPARTTVGPSTAGKKRRFLGRFKKIN